MKQRYYGITQNQNIVILATIEGTSNQTEAYAAAVRHNKEHPTDIIIGGIVNDSDLYRIITQAQNALNTLPY